MDVIYKIILLPFHNFHDLKTMKTVKEHLVVHVLSTANHDVQLCFRSDSYSLEVCETVVRKI